jgi:hypothetical protein
MYELKACEYFFGMAHQINFDFNYFKLFQLIPKISQYAKVLKAKNIILKKKKSVCKGKLFNCNLKIN